MLTHNPQENSLLIYKNTKDNSNQRISEIKKSIKNNSDNTGILLNIYVREKSNNNKCYLMMKILLILSLKNL